MESRMTIVLSDEERAALRRASQQELRTMRDQARHLLRLELERRGLLSRVTDAHEDASSQEARS